MNKTIDERAKTSYLRSNVQGLTIASSHEVGYIQGATEQQDIDIEKASMAFCKTCIYRKDKCEGDWRCFTYAEFRKAMEE